MNGSELVTAMMRLGFQPVRQVVGETAFRKLYADDVYRMQLVSVFQGDRLLRHEVLISVVLAPEFASEAPEVMQHDIEAVAALRPGADLPVGVCPVCRQEATEFVEREGVLQCLTH